MKKYSDIFFDLDHTIWDFNHNSKETLLELYQESNLGTLSTFEDFFIVYQKVNEELWKAYHQGRIHKEQLRITRFRKVFQELGHTHVKELALFFADEYVKRSPYRGKLISGTIELLDFLKTRYRLHIITNGFKEVQYIKIKCSGLHEYFDKIFISEEIGHQKPDLAIFKYVEQKCAVIPSSCLMIGDNEETDIVGAYNSGWDTVWFNPEKKDKSVVSTFQIARLQELHSVL